MITITLKAEHTSLMKHVCLRLTSVRFTIKSFLVTGVDVHVCCCVAAILNQDECPATQKLTSVILWNPQFIASSD